MNSIVARLQDLEQVLDAVVSEAFAVDEIQDLSPGEIAELLAAAGRVRARVDAVQVEAVDVVVSRSTGLQEERMTTAFGCSRPTDLVRLLTGADETEASRVVRVSKLVHRVRGITDGAFLPARYPALRDALIDGEISVAGFVAAVGPLEHARRRISEDDRLIADAQLAALARGITPTRGEDDPEDPDSPDSPDDTAGDATTDGVDDTADDATADGVDDAADGSGDGRGPRALPEELGVFARVIVAYLDPDGAEPSADEDAKGRYLNIGPLKDGVHQIRGALLPEIVAQLLLLLDAILNPRITPPNDPTTSTGAGADTDTDTGNGACGTNGNGTSGTSGSTGDSADTESGACGSTGNDTDTGNGKNRPNASGDTGDTTSDAHDTDITNSTTSPGEPDGSGAEGAMSTSGVLPARPDAPPRPPSPTPPAAPPSPPGPPQAAPPGPPSAAPPGALPDLLGSPPGGVRFEPSTDPGTDHTLDDPSFTDTRTRGQKLHDAFAMILNAAAASTLMPTIGGAPPTLVVTATATDITQGTGWASILNTGDPIPLSSALQTGCAGGIQRILFDPNGRIASLGTSARIFNALQRRAITIRDGGCIIPGCTVPAPWCEIHHVIEHAHDGPTHTDNGVLLCWWHHRTLHLTEWTIRMNNSTPEIKGPTWWDPHHNWHHPTSPHQRPARRPAPA